MTKLLIIGLDGATFDLIKPWAAQGKLPTLAKLMQTGVTGNLESTLPPVTSPAWPTFMTGKNPGKHGVFDFIRPRAGTFDMVNASQIKSKLLWEILSEAGYSVGVLNVPITYPPRPVNGYMIPGLLSPDQGKTVYPAELLKPYEAELGKYRLTPNVQYKAGNEAEFIADLHDLIDTQLRYALRLMKDQPTDVVMLHFLATDNGSHALWRFMDPTHPRYDAALAPKYSNALQKVYQHLDEAVAKVQAAAGAELQATVVMSDHGFGPLHRTINLNILFLEKLLQKFDPVTIYGGIPIGEETDLNFREARIRKFHNDENCKILIGNPQACGEGISLHKASHYAIYLDRNFNAAYYLQSVDRIHRLGLDKNVDTHVEIIVAEKSIDEVLIHRLNSKVYAMGKVLDDPNLTKLTYDPMDVSEEDTFGIDQSDVKAIKSHISD